LRLPEFRSGNVKGGEKGEGEKVESWDERTVVPLEVLRLKRHSS
jgi:hypothetical protein